MPLGTTAYDRKISDLISEVQRYSNPNDHFPRPPSIPYPSAERTLPREEERERAEPPPWFNPIEHPDDGASGAPECSDDVPIVDGAGEVADPSDGEKSQIAGSAIEALAFYAPFHFYRRNRWGIYVRDYGIAYLASLFLGRRRLTQSDNWALRRAYWLLIEHEYFHFQTEIAASRYESVTGDQSAYEQAFHDIHISGLEESMANARAYQWLKKHEDIQVTISNIAEFQDFAWTWMKQQPPGYRDFDKWCSNSNRVFDRARPRGNDNVKIGRGHAEITARIHEISCYRRQRSSCVSSEVLRPYKNAEYSRVPIVRVHDAGISWLRSTRLFPKELGVQVMVHARDHPPPHIHVIFSNNARAAVRLNWEELTPLPDERQLSRKERRDLNEYVQKFRDDIGEKVTKVYANCN